MIGSGIFGQVAKLPYAVLVNELGIVAAQGLVNRREHLESLVTGARARPAFRAGIPGPPRLGDCVSRPFRQP
jgi:hypothetical protein